MIGIYKITKKENGKSYIGQSCDCDRRIKEHCSPNRYKLGLAIDIAIHKYGVNAFTYEIIEECSIDKLNERESYWIEYYNTLENGYNLSKGGNQQSVGENNGRARLTEQDVIAIRQAYNNHEKQKDVYKNYKDKITFSNFQSVWQGKTWTYIMPEVYTEENKKYYVYENSLGGNGAAAAFTDEEVLALRKRYVEEDARTIYQDYQDRVKYNTFQALLWGRTYKHLPIYKKKEKKWINI